MKWKGDNIPPRPGLDTNTILNATAHIVDESGLDQMTLNTLAEQLGVKTPSLYNHISGLPDLKQKLAIYGIHELSARLAAAAIGKSKDDALRAIIYAHRTFAEERPGLYEAICRFHSPFDPEMQIAVDGLMDVIRKVLEPYHLQKDQENNMIKIVRGMVHGFVTLRASGSFCDQSTNLDDNFQLMLDIFFIGFHQIVDSSKGSE